ncbi:MAG TPA: DUF2848 domain-containing protein [Acidobacteriaceae bacterium]|jgi:hypothetical protein
MNDSAAPPSTHAFSAQTAEGLRHFAFASGHLVLAGWVGRDAEALEAHIRELAALGVARPTATPVFYRVATSLVTQAATVQVSGLDATGEAEVVVFRHDGQDWVTVGSDITDRKAEAIGVTLSKQLCAKPLAREAWLLAECRDHWDRLILRSWIEVNGERHVYQDGPVASMRLPWELMALYKENAVVPTDVMMFCGTLPVHGSIRWSDSFSVELWDPVLDRGLAFTYRVESLPVAG